MITPHITGLQVDLTKTTPDIISPLSVVRSVSHESNASKRKKSATTLKPKLTIVEASVTRVGASRSKYSSKKDNTELLLRRPVIRRESLSVKDLLAQVVEEPGFTARLSKSMTDLKSYDKSNHESPKENRSVPRRDYMPVEVLALQTMDLEDEERAALCSRLSRSMTDLQLSPKSKAFDNITTVNSKVRRKLALTKSDSSQYMMPALPVREDSFNLSDNQNAQFSTPLRAIPHAYIDELIMKSTLSVKSSWYKKQLSQVAQPSEVHARFATSEPPVKQNIFINSLHTRVRKGDNYHSSLASSSPDSKGRLCGHFSKSMSDLSMSQQSFHARLSRSHSSEKIPMMPMRRGSVETGSRSKNVFLAALSESELSRIPTPTMSSPQHLTQMVSSPTPSHFSKASGLSAASSLTRSSLSSALSEFSRSPCGHPDMSRSRSSERMPMKPMRRCSVATAHNETSVEKHFPLTETHAQRSLSEDIERLIMKSALSVKSSWHLKHAVDEQERFPDETQKVFYDTYSVQSLMTRGYSASDRSCSSGVPRFSKSMSELRSALSSFNGGVVSERSRCHSSARMPTMPMRRGSINDGSALAENAPNIGTSPSLPTKSFMNKLVSKSSQPVQLQHSVASVNRPLEREAGVAISKPVAKSNIFFDTTGSRKFKVGEPPNS
jgi:hypothetical protein